MNETLELKSKLEFDRVVRGYEKTIEERFQEDLKAFSERPSVDFDSCSRIETNVNSQLLVRFDKNDYSVPFEYAYQEVTVKGYFQHVEIYRETNLVAKHERLYTKFSVSYDPIHYLPLLERKPRALDQAAPLER